jgi:hypothetical protein
LEKVIGFIENNNRHRRNTQNIATNFVQ